MGRLDGKVAFISGVARGQGRSHAVRLAQEGANIIGFDICQNIDTIRYPLATLADLEQTIKLVENQDRRIVAKQADVRDLAAVQAVFDEGVAEFGRVDIIIANAGGLFGDIASDRTWERIMPAWQDGIDVMLTGVFKTIAAALPTMVAGGEGGSIVITSSTAGLKSMLGPQDSAEAAMGGAVSYVASKHGVVGVMKALAGSLAHLNIRVNTIHPTAVNTPFIVNEDFERMLAANEGKVSWQNAMPIDMIEPEDVSNAIVWLCSEEGRYVTGIQLPIDAGFLIR